MCCGTEHSTSYTYTRPRPLEIRMEMGDALLLYEVSCPLIPFGRYLLLKSQNCAIWRIYTVLLSLCYGAKLNPSSSTPAARAAPCPTPTLSHRCTLYNQSPSRPLSPHHSSHPHITNHSEPNQTRPPNTKFSNLTRIPTTDLATESRTTARHFSPFSRVCPCQQTATPPRQSPQSQTWDYSFEIYRVKTV